MVQCGLVNSSDTLVLTDLEFRLLDLDYLTTLAPLHPSLACLASSTHHPKPERHLSTALIIPTDLAAYRTKIYQGLTIFLLSPSRRRRRNTKHHP